MLPNNPIADAYHNTYPYADGDAIADAYRNLLPLRLDHIQHCRRKRN